MKFQRSASSSIRASAAGSAVRAIPAAGSTLPTPSPSPVVTYLVAASSALFFCSKGVFVKTAYAGGADTVTVLALRMGFALPFFAAAAIWTNCRAATRISGRQWIEIIVLGFVGYYLASLVNFLGLRFISVGLERIVLFTYPSLVVLGTALARREWPSRPILAGMAVAYLGIVVAFIGEAGAAGSAAAGAPTGIRGTLIGVALVFASAVTYAVFLSRSAGLVRELGAFRFTAHVVTVSCLLILLHYAATHPPAGLFSQQPGVLRSGVVLALVGTVVPSFLMGLGLKHAGARRFAIIGTIGPVGTLVLAWIVLGESLDPVRATGFALSLAGGIIVARAKT